MDEGVTELESLRMRLMDSAESLKSLHINITLSIKIDGTVSLKGKDVLGSHSKSAQTSV